MRQVVTNIALRPRQRSVAAVLASGHAIAAVCRSKNVSRATIYRWMRQPSFRTAINAAIADRQQAERNLIGKVAKATLCLAMRLDDRQFPQTADLPNGESKALPSAAKLPSA